ncbi:MAG: adaptor protein MecA [Lachnospiraceae bacterium]|nr:adaptor protein MecA [Lachnospiraceae bacterium]
MRFTKLGENDIRCVITETELINYGLSMDDILERNGRMKEFFRAVLDMGSKELGMRKKDGIHLASAQISVLKDNSISIIFHETSVEEILRSLVGDDKERLAKLERDIAENIKKNPQRLSKEVRNEIVDFIEDKIRREGHLTPAVMAEIRQIREEINSDDYDILASEGRFKMCAIRFRSLDDAIRYCTMTDYTGEFTSALYKSAKDEEFYLIIYRNDMPLEKYSGLLFGASEFGSVMELTDAGRAFLLSHTETMIEDDAYNKLKSVGKK